MKTLKLPLRIEPGLVALLCAWFYFDPAGTFLPFVCAAALHEAGHLAMLLWLRQPVHSLCLGLQGAVLRTGPLRYRDELREILWLETGAVTPLALLNAPDVTLYLDEALLGSRIAVHPNTNTATVWLQTADLVSLLRTQCVPVVTVPFPCLA